MGHDGAHTLVNAAVGRLLAAIFRGLAILGAVLALFGLAPWSLPVALFIASVLVAPGAWARVKSFLWAGILLAVLAAAVVGGWHHVNESGGFSAWWKTDGHIILIATLCGVALQSWLWPAVSPSDAVPPSGDDPSPGAAEQLAPTRASSAPSTTYWCDRCDRTWAPEDMVEVNACEDCSVRLDPKFNGHTCPACGCTTTRRVTQFGCPECLEDLVPL